MSYLNPRAKQYDIASVRSIFTIRGGQAAPHLERARAVLVTSNRAFAKAAWGYGQRYEGFRDVSSVITDFSLANMAWLKVPMGAIGVPTTQLLSYSYAALQPSRPLLDRYMEEIDKLEARGDVPERALLLLRSSPRVYDELTSLTLGDDSVVGEGLLSEIHTRVANEIKKEEADKLNAERQAHRETRDALRAHRDQEQQRIEGVYWRCADQARVVARVVWYTLGAMCVVGAAGSLGLRASNPYWAIAVASGSSVLTVVALGNLMTGSTVARWSSRAEAWCHGRLLRRAAGRIGVDLRQFDLP